MSKFTNGVQLERIGEALYGARWKTYLAADLGLTPRTMRLYDSMQQAVPDAVLDRARGLARARAERLLKLAGDAQAVDAAEPKAVKKRAPKAGTGTTLAETQALLAPAKPEVRRPDLPLDADLPRFGPAGRWRSIEPWRLVSEADRHMAKQPMGMPKDTWKEMATVREIVVRSRDTHVEMVLSHVGTHHLRLWTAEPQRRGLDHFDVRSEKGRMALAGLEEWAEG